MASCLVSEQASPVSVAVRVRPLLLTDRPHEVICAQALPYAQQTVVGNKSFQSDYSFSTENTQSHIFEKAVVPLLDRFIQGYDISLIAYGQSASGKTYTVLGPGVHCAFSETEYGIIPRSVRYIFAKMGQGVPKKFKVRIGFVEVHNDMLRDLLVSSQFQQDLVLLESEAGYPVITGLQEMDCETVSEVFNCLHIGMQNHKLEWSVARQAGRSSQSHCIFTISLEQQWVTPDGFMEQRLSIARFTDLASSEKIFYRGPRGEILGESMCMDPGLLAIGNIVASLSQPPQWTGYETNQIYRQSTLTKILKESFGGRCHSLVICCISPASLNFDETLMTLRFAERVKNITNTPVLNALSTKVRTEVIDESKKCSSEQLSGNYSIGDAFGLEFAASQWFRLVDKAEGLFNMLINNNSIALSEEDRDSIEKWLCLKQECEDCVGSDECGSVTGTGNQGRLLDKIEEVTENEEKSDSSKEEEDETRENEELLSKCASDSDNDESPRRPDFLDKLDEYIKRFKKGTDKAVRNLKDNIKSPEIEEDEQKEDSDKEVENRVPNNGRRRSIRPGTQMPLVTLRLNLQESENKEDNDNDCSNTVTPVTSVTKTAEDKKEEKIPDVLLQTGMDLQQEIKCLSAKNEKKQIELKQVLARLEVIYTESKELDTNIKIQEEFIRVMVRDTGIRNTAKENMEIKHSKIKKKFEEIHTLLGKAKQKQEIDQYKKLLVHYEQKLKRINKQKTIAADSTKKILELENSLQSYKRQMKKLRSNITKDEAQKSSLEKQIQEYHEKLAELQESLNTQTIKMEKQERSDSAANSEEERLRWIQEEEERLVSMRESSQRFQEQLLQHQSILDKREAIMKEKFDLEKQRAHNIKEVSAQISQLDHLLQEKSTDLEKIKDEDEKEAVRVEIQNLRTTRECYIEKKERLNHKSQNGKKSTQEERKLIQCDEAIEAIDTAIEYKNGLICGRTGGLDDIQSEDGEGLLMDRLNKLPVMEMRIMLYKYFQKVVDLRDNGRKMEEQIIEKEQQIDAQLKEIKLLCNALIRHRLETDRKITVLHWTHQEQLHSFYANYAEESSTGEGGTKPKEQNRKTELKPSKNQETTSAGPSTSGLHSHKFAFKDSRDLVPETVTTKKSNRPSLRRLVTRQKNKIIITQEGTRKTAKN